MATVMESSPANTGSVQICLAHVWAHKGVVGLSPANNLSRGQWSIVDEFWDLFNLSCFLFLLPVETFDWLPVCHYLVKYEYWVRLSVPIFVYSILLFENLDVRVLVVDAIIVIKNWPCSSLFDLILFLINFLFPSLDLLRFVQWDLLGLFPPVVCHFLMF